MTKEQLLEDLAKETNNHTDPLRGKGWDAFLKKGLPSKKGELFRYFPLEKLYKMERERKESQCLREEITPFLVTETYPLVFIDGEFQQELSTLPEGVVILPLEKAFASYGALLKNRFTQVMEEDKNPFSLLNQALYKEGLFIYVPPKLPLERCLHFLFFTKNKTWTHPRVEVCVGAQAQVKGLTTFVPLGEMPCCDNSFLNISLEEGASFSLFDYPQKLSEGIKLEKVRATLKRDSQFKSFHFLQGGDISHHDIHIRLNGENSEATLKGLHLLEGRQEAHSSILIEHVAKETRSHQHFKNIVSDQATASFEGKIFVHQKAQQTQAYQLNNNFLIGEKAQAFCRPNLEIFADDVKASHGATCIRPNEEELFYLRARGLSKEEGEKQLIRGFCRELIEEIEVEQIQIEMERQIKDYLRG